MQIKDPGHTYVLANVETGEQSIQFIRKERGPQDSEKSTLKTLKDGTTNEEVLSMLIDRMQFLNGKVPCDQNLRFISLLQESLALLNKRTDERKTRRVEGTNQV